MLLTPNLLALVNTVIQVDAENKARTFNLADLTIASEVFKELKKNVKDDKFIEGEVEFTSEQKVFITKLVDERNWSVLDADAVFEIKSLLK